MIKVENLTKKYAGQTAIRDLTFDVGQGEIMGFLGPNGAGKTTTMRILASFLPATSGRASIAGFDVFEQSLQARAHLGYMPENVPRSAPMPTRRKPARSKIARCGGLASQRFTTHVALAGPHARFSPNIGPAAPEARTRDAKAPWEK